MIKRALDWGLSNYHYSLSDQIVICPHCEKPTILEYIPDPTYKLHGSFKFTCQHCLHHLNDEKPNTQNGHFYIRADGRCAKCGGQWLYAREKLVNSGALPQFIEKQCTYCNHTTQFHQYQQYFEYENKIGFTAFGLELYLKTPTRWGELFVYNQEQLSALKSFIQAPLRERTQSAGNSSYFSRLPAWIKSARNRQEILKALLRLEQMATTIQP